MPAVTAALRAALYCAALSSIASASRADVDATAALATAPAPAVSSVPAALPATTAIAPAPPLAEALPANSSAPVANDKGTPTATRLSSSDVATAADEPSAPPALEFFRELDAYYSSAALQIPLTTAPVPDGGRLPEREVYTRLFRDSLRPRLLMLEASVYPLPAAGTALKRHQAGRYEDFNIGNLGSNQLNLIDAVTAGFQEPWALSVFTGSSMRFTEPGQPGTGRNRGYMGYLVSHGAKHIRNNRLIDDDWWELEWKLKGERQFRDEELDWSFRIGAKTHGNPDISDVAYIALRRSNLDYASSWLSLLSNSDLKLLSEFDQRNGRYLRQELIVGRKFPLRRWRIALELEAGVIYENPAKYRGDLVDPSADTLNFVLRPHVNF